MSYGIPWSSQTIIYAVLLLFALPFVITSGTEFLFTRKLTLGVSIISLVLSTAILIVGVLQITTSKVVVNRDSIKLSSLMYTENIDLNDIGHVSEVYDNSLPASAKPTLRKNGVGLFGYNAGLFKFGDKTTGFVMVAQPPYLVVELNKDSKKVVFSADHNVHKMIKENLSLLGKEKSS